MFYACKYCDNSMQTKIGKIGHLEYTETQSEAWITWSRKKFLNKKENESSAKFYFLNFLSAFPSKPVEIPVDFVINMRKKPISRKKVICRTNISCPDFTQSPMLARSTTRANPLSPSPHNIFFSMFNTTVREGEENRARTQRRETE